MFSAIIAALGSIIAALGTLPVWAIVLLVVAVVGMLAVPVIGLLLVGALIVGGVGLVIGGGFLTIVLIAVNNVVGLDSVWEWIKDLFSFLPF